MPRPLALESLEDRCFLSAEAVASAVSPGWFQDYTQPGAFYHAGAGSWGASGVSEGGAASITGQPNVYDWIVRFNSASLAGVDSAAGSVALLDGRGVDFQVLRGLGLTGQVLVRSSGASVETVEGALAHNSCVASFEMDAVRQLAAVPNDPQFSNLWGLNNTGQSGGLPGADIHAQAAWNVSTGSRNVVVAEIDTGVDYTHPDLAANIWTNPGEITGNGRDDDGDGFVDDVHGYDFANNDGDPRDDNSHGTHVAGILAAAGNNGQGVAGVNWNGSIMALKTLSANGSGYTSDAVRAVNYATMMRTRYGVNVRVINASWGGGAASAALRDAIRAAGDAGILFVAAAGNSGQNNDASPNYPSSYDSPNVLAVAATDRSDRLATFSNYGSTSVDLAAPGVSIYSTVPGGRYASYSGTSMATPYVAGVAALAWSVAPNATVAQIRDAILQGVDRLGSLSGKVASGGRLDAYNTLKLLAAPAPRPPVIGSLVVNSTAVNAGATVTLTARGVSDPDGAVSTVSFYLDSNGNNQWDAADRFLGTDTSIVNQEASITVSTSGMAASQRLVFAVATDSQGQRSQAASAVLNVLPRQNTPPALAAISPQVISYRQNSYTLALSAADADGDALTYTARAFTVDPLAQKACALDQQLGLSFAGSYFENFAGAGEKYLLGNGGQWYYVLPNGEFHHWTGSLAASPLVDRLSTAYYANPALLYDAPAAGERPVDGVTLSVSGDRLTIGHRSGLLGSFSVRVTVSDGTATDTKTFDVSVVNSPPQLAAVGDQTMPGTQRSLQIVLRGSDADGDPLTYTAQLQAADPMAQLAWSLDQSLGLRFAGSYYENFAGAHERYMLGNNSTWYYILPNGELHRLGSSLGASPLVAQLTSDYYANPALLHDAQPPASASNNVTLALSGNVLTITRRDGAAGNFQVLVRVTDGTSSCQQTFQLTVSASTTASVAGLSFETGTLSVDPRASAAEDSGAAIDDLAAAGRLDEVATAGRLEFPRQSADASSEPLQFTATEQRLQMLDALSEELATHQGFGAAALDRVMAEQWSDRERSGSGSPGGIKRWTDRGSSGSAELEEEILDGLFAMLDEIQAASLTTGERA